MRCCTRPQVRCFPPRTKTCAGGAFTASSERVCNFSLFFFFSNVLKRALPFLCSCERGDPKVRGRSADGHRGRRVSARACGVAAAAAGVSGRSRLLLPSAIGDSHVDSRRSARVFGVSARRPATAAAAAPSAGDSDAAGAEGRPCERGAARHGDAVSGRAGDAAD